MFNLVSNHSRKNITKKSDSAFTSDLDVFAKTSPGRTDVESFIINGFQKSYNASVSVNMPWVLAIKDGQFKAALGIRSAVNPLFIEQYLDTPIENVISNVASNVSRDEIAEIGNLYSNAKRFTLPLFLVTAVSLFCNNYRYMVFSGTEHVLKLIQKIGVDTRFIVDADQNKLNPSTDDWGSYYHTNPKVVSISLASVMSIIENNDTYATLFSALTPKIVQTTSRLRGELS